MISDKSFTLQEFQTKIPEFAQALINKVTQVSPDSKLSLTQESQRSYLVTIEKPNGNESYILALDNEGKVNTLSVYGA